MYAPHTQLYCLLRNLLFCPLQIQEEFDNGYEIVFDPTYHVPPDVTSLLKIFFRDLPEPLLTRELYPAFMATASESSVCFRHPKPWPRSANGNTHARNTHTHTHTHTHTLSLSLSLSHTHTKCTLHNTHTHAHMHTRTHACTHARTHAHTHALTHSIQMRRTPPLLIFFLSI